MPPQPADLLAVVAAHLDLNTDAGQPARGQPGVHLAGQGLGGEHDPFGLPGRRIELDLDGQVRRRRTRGQRPRIEPAGEPVREQPLRPEPVAGLGGRNSGELPQRPDPEPDQQVGQVRLAEHGDRARCQEGRRPARRHDRDRRLLPLAVPGRQQRGEQAVGDASAAVIAEPGDNPCDLPGEFRLAAEVPSRAPDPERAQPGPQHLDPRAELLHRGDHPLERPRRRAGCLARLARLARLAGYQGWRVPGRAAHGQDAPVAIRAGHPVLACSPGELATSLASSLSTAVTVPSGPGSHSQRACGLDQPPRPSATTWARRPRSLPCPGPIPAHSCAAIRSLICAPSQSPATSSTEPCRRTAASSLRRAWAGGPARRAQHDQVTAVEQGDDHLRPVRAELGDQQQPGGIQPGIGRRGDAELGYPRRRAPRASGHGPGCQGQAEQVPAARRHHRAASQRAVRQQVTQRRKHGKQVRVGQRPAARADLPAGANRPIGHLDDRAGSHRASIEQIFDSIKRDANRSGTCS